MATDPDASDRKGEISTHEKFNVSDADVVVQSSDGVQFHLHRKYLEAYTGNFPLDNARSMQSDDQQIVVHLTEPAETLQILFEFVYPKRLPDLEGMEFGRLARLSEAVEKYEVFSAMSICQMVLRPFMADHPADILAHGLKYDISKVINEAALHLCRTRTPLNKISEVLPARGHMPWVSTFLLNLLFRKLGGDPSLTMGRKIQGARVARLS